MKKKNDMMFILVFAVIVGISLLYLSQASYAKYRRKIDATLNAQVANWNIKVNNETINNKTVLNNTIQPSIVENAYVKDGTIAPGTTGYFDIVINAEDCDVDFSYEITGAADEDTPLLDFVITEYEIGGVRNPYSDVAKITGEKEKNSGDTSVRVYFKWNDDPETEEMDNQEDTEYAISDTNQNTKIKVSIKFTQKKS